MHSCDLFGVWRLNRDYDELYVTMCTQHHEQLKAMHVNGGVHNSSCQTKGWRGWIEKHKQELDEFEQQHDVVTGPSAEMDSVGEK